MVQCSTLGNAKKLFNAPIVEINNRKAYLTTIDASVSPKKFCSMPWRRACIIHAAIIMPAVAFLEIGMAGVDTLESLAKVIYQFCRLICARPGAWKALKDYAWKTLDSIGCMFVLFAKTLIDFVRLIGGALILPVIAVKPAYRP